MHRSPLASVLRADMVNKVLSDKDPAAANLRAGNRSGLGLDPKCLRTEFEKIGCLREVAVSRGQQSREYGTGAVEQFGRFAAISPLDEEIRQLVDRNYQRATTILTANMDKLNLMADALIKYETIDSEQIDEIMAGKTPRPPEDWDDSEPKSGHKLDAGADKEKDAEEGGPIGGPISQH